MRNKKLFVTVMAAVLAMLMIFPLLLTILGAATGMAASQSEIDSLKNKQQGIAESKAILSNEIAQLEEEQASALEQKAALDRQNELTRQEIELINEQIDILAIVISNKERELQEAVEAEEKQMELYRGRVRAMEEMGSYSYIGILFNSTSFTDFLSRIDFVGEIMESDKQLEENCKAARENVEVMKADFEEAKKQEEITRLELVSKKEQLEKEIEAADKMIQEIEEGINNRLEEYLANEAEEKRIQGEIDEMIAELQRQEEERKKAAEAAAAQGGGGGYYGDGGSVTGTGSYIWPLPANNVVSSPYGTRIHPIFQTERFHSGIDVGAPSGSPLYAADSGTVSIAVYSSSYGNYVVINHGGGNTTLYAHMSSMAVSAGDTVSQGDIIGYVGSTGWSTGPHLHFEITSGGARVNPESYFSNLVKGY